MWKSKIKSLFFCVFLFYAMTVNAQKTVEVIASGNGNNKDEALRNALRDAIEQTFGTFITSSSVVINDAMAKDEIATISSGNIKKYVILSENDSKITIKATVSLSSLGSFCKNNGIAADFEGTIFGAAIKQQELNEKGEKIALENLLFVVKNILTRSFDYVVVINDPIIDKGNEYFLPVGVKVYTNENIKLAYQQILQTFDALNMSSAEVENYKKIGKKVHKFYLANQEMPQYIGQEWKWNYDKLNTYTIRNERNPLLELFSGGSIEERRGMISIGEYGPSLVHYKIMSNFKLIFEGTNEIVPGSNMAFYTKRSAPLKDYQIQQGQHASLSKEEGFLKLNPYDLNISSFLFRATEDPLTFPNKKGILVGAFIILPRDNIQGYDYAKYPLPKSSDFISKIRKVVVKPNN